MVFIGRNVRRKDGSEKVTGQALYVDDLKFPGMIHGRTIRSSIACGEVRDVRLGFDTVGTHGFVVVDHKDISGKNVHALIEHDQPMLVERTIQHAEEPIILLAHEDRDVLRAAHVDIHYDVRTPVLDPLASTRALKTLRIEKGDLDAGFAKADQIIEGEYRTGHQEHAYIETQGVIAVPGEDGSITVYGSLQCPYYVHGALTVLLGLPNERVRVIQTETGGGFGGKEEYPSMIAGHAALLALKAHRPVKMIYDRGEDMRATTKRHPSIVRHRTGVTRSGELVAMDIEVVMNAGAYTTLSPVVLSRGILHATGPYRCEHVRVVGRAMMTNTPPNGAFRGFGAPQTIFAAEVHMERIAEALGMDPVRIREKNALRPGDETATGQVLGADTSALEVLREAVKRTDFRRRRKSLAKEGRGLGLALYFHGSGFTGSGELRLASEATLELTQKGACVRVSSTEIGQGTRTILAQIVADGLGMAYADVDVSPVDTREVPDSGPTVASRTCMIVGKLLERCAEDMRRKLGKLTPAQYLARHGPLSITRRYEKPDEIVWDESTYHGSAYGTYGWACDVAEVELDSITYEVRPVKLTAVVELGRAIHPMLARGQVEGGTAQGIGYALLEEVTMQGGRMSNASLTNYILPTTLDTPPMDVVLLERPYAHGPGGAKGLGELPMDGPAPAIVNAIRHMGLDVCAIPATPERIAEAVCASS